MISSEAKLDRPAGQWSGKNFLDGKDKAVYKPSKWRGTWSTQVEVKAIEVWNHFY